MFNNFLIIKNYNILMKKLTLLFLLFSFNSFANDHGEKTDEGLIILDEKTAENQMAGSAEDTDAVFEKNLANCTDLKVAMLRGKLLLDMNKACTQAKDVALEKLEEGIKLCSEGNSFMAQMTLQEGIDAAVKGNISGRDLTGKDCSEFDVTIN